VRRAGQDQVPFLAEDIRLSIQQPSSTSSSSRLAGRSKTTPTLLRALPSGLGLSERVRGRWILAVAGSKCLMGENMTTILVRSHLCSCSCGPVRWTVRSKDILLVRSEIISLIGKGSRCHASRPRPALISVCEGPKVGCGEKGLSGYLSSRQCIFLLLGASR
jgi:hypothetical protein